MTAAGAAGGILSHPRSRRRAALAAAAALLVAGTLTALPFTSPSSSVVPPPARDLEAEMPATPQVMLVSAYHLRMRGRKGGTISPTAEPAEPQTTATTLTVERGDTLMGLLVDAGAARGQAYEAIEALSEVFSPRKLRVGQEIAVTFGPAAPPQASGEAELIAAAASGRMQEEDLRGGQAAPSLLSIRLRPSVEQDVEVVRDAAAAAYVARVIERQLDLEPRYAEGEIDSSLFAAAEAAGVPHEVLVDAVRTFSFDVDFQRDIQKGDSFRLFYDGYRDDSGAFVKSGDVLFAELVLSGKPLRLYRYTPESGVTDYFNEDGQSVRKTLLRTPVDGARLSSGFGPRRHPVLGYNKVHKGLDFAAPTGTPIYAAGDGVVEKAGRWSSYGIYARIRHNGTYKTAYAHMSKLGKGITAGARVKQGQIIGYVGATGRVTGPHLHYEVLVDGKQVNPRNIELPSGEILAGADLEAFQSERARIERSIAELGGAPQVASGD